MLVPLPTGTAQIKMPPEVGGFVEMDKLLFNLNSGHRIRHTINLQQGSRSA